MAAGVSEAAFTEYVRVMGFSVDFQREIRNGDRFELLYETAVTALMAGGLGAATLRRPCSVRSTPWIFRYDKADDIVGWYDEEGNSAARTQSNPIQGQGYHHLLAGGSIR